MNWKSNKTNRINKRKVKKREKKKKKKGVIWAWMKQDFKRKMGVSYWVYFELGLGYLKGKEMGLSGLIKRKRNGLEWAV